MSTGENPKPCMGTERSITLEFTFKITMEKIENFPFFRKTFLTSSNDLISSARR